MDLDDLIATSTAPPKVAPRAAAAPGGLDLDSLITQASASGNAAPSDVGGWQAAASGLGQAALGFGDEIGAGLQALYASSEKRGPINEQLAAFGKTYRQALSENRDIDKASKEQHPEIYYPAMAAGMIGTAPALPAARAAKGATFAERLLAHTINGVGQGGAFGLGTSEGKDATSVASDAAKYAAGGGALGVAGGLAGESLSAGGRLLSGVASRRAAAQGADEAAAAVASAHGTARKAIADANATLRSLRESLADPAVTAETRAKIGQFLQSPEGQELRESVARNGLEVAPERVGAANTAKALAQAATEQQPEEAARIASSKLSAKGIGQQFLARFKRYGAPALIGHAMGNTSAGLVLRPMFHSLLRLAKHPAFPAVAGATGQGLGYLLGSAAERAGPLEQQLLPAFFQDAAPLMPAASTADANPDVEQLARADALRKLTGANP